RRISTGMSKMCPTLFVASATYVDLVQQDKSHSNEFLAGVLVGIAGAATIALLQELTRSRRRRISSTAEKTEANGKPLAADRDDETAQTGHSPAAERTSSRRTRQASPKKSRSNSTVPRICYATCDTLAPIIHGGRFLARDSRWAGWWILILGPGYDGIPAGGPCGRGSTGPAGSAPSVVAGTVRCWSWWLRDGGDPIPGGGDRLGPWPGCADLEAAPAAAACPAS